MKILCRRPLSLALVCMLALISPSAAAQQGFDSLSLRVGANGDRAFDARDVHRSMFARGVVQLDDGAQRDAFVVTQHLVDAGALRLGRLPLRALRGVGVSVGAGWNRHILGNGASKRMLVAGPTLTWNVPGYLSTSLLLRHETDPLDPFGGAFRPVLSANWAIPLARRWAFEGYASLSSPKGREDGLQHGGASVELQLMYDASAAMGYRKNAFRIGLEYQYADNKFGNTWLGAGGAGFRTRAPGLRAEYRFIR